MKEKKIWKDRVEKKSEILTTEWYWEEKKKIKNK